MLDIVKELVPLLEGATSGAMWLIVGYFGVVLIKAGLLFTFFLVTVLRGARLISDSIGVSKDKLHCWTTSDGIKVVLYRSEADSLMKAIATCGSVRSTDVMRVKRLIESSEVVT